MERRLDVLISTLGQAGILRVADMELPSVDGVTYIVSWQTAGADPAGIPSRLDRPDLLVFPNGTKGISINRNLAMSHAEAPVCLTADDDLKYTSAQLMAVIELFDRNPEVEVASFMYSGAVKPYPSEETDISKKLPKGMWSTAFEVAYRTDSVRGKVRYDENFGPGEHPLQAGEDPVFMLDCQRAGLNCRFFPLVVTSHHHPSTGSRPIAKRGVAMADGAYLRKAYGICGFPRVPLCAWRNYRKGRCGFWWGLRAILSGFFMRLDRPAD